MVLYIMTLPGMQDGRMTNWDSNCSLNTTMMKLLNVKSDREYRELLQSKKLTTVLKNIEKKLDTN